MKNTNIKRQAVFPVLMMLVVTALALIGSSFAWFTVANTATVAQITTKAQSDGVRLEISKDAVKYGTRSIDVNNGAISAILPGTLYQVSTTGLLRDAQNTGISTFEFFDSKYSGINVETGTEYIVSKKDLTVEIDNTGKLKTRELVGANYGEDGATYGESFDATTPTYIVFDLFFATDRKADIYFYDGTSVKGRNANDTSYSETAEVLKALRVGVAYLGSTETAADVVALDGDESNSVAIWEVVKGTTPTYGINKDSYNAGANDTEVEFAPYSNTDEAASYVNTTAVVTYGSSLIVTNKDDVTGNDKLFSTPAPSAETVERVYSKVRVYVWLEGNDPDCVSKVASSDIQINLVFFAKEAQ